MQVDLSEKEAAIACKNSQLQEEQEHYIRLQNKAEAENNEAAATATTQMQQSEQLAQQLQAQLDAARLHGKALQSTCDTLSRKSKDLTAELLASKASAETSQVSLIILAAKAATLQATVVCTSEQWHFVSILTIAPICLYALQGCDTSLFLGILVLVWQRIETCRAF